MLTLTWAQLNSQPFVSAMVALNNNSRLDNQTAYRVGRICQVAQREMEKARKLENDLRVAHTKLQDSGDPVVDEEALDRDFKKALEETKVQVKVHKLEFAKLNGLNGLQLTAIEDIVDGLPDVA